MGANTLIGGVGDDTIWWDGIGESGVFPHTQAAVVALTAGNNLINGLLGSNPSGFGEPVIFTASSNSGDTSGRRPCWNLDLLHQSIAAKRGKRD